MNIFLETKVFTLLKSTQELSKDDPLERKTVFQSFIIPRFAEKKNKTMPYPVSLKIISNFLEFLNFFFFF